jgi:uncharacterized protein
LIQSYGERRFTISDKGYQGSVVVRETSAEKWPVLDPAEIDLRALSDILDTAKDEERDCDIMLVGCGARFFTPPRGLSSGLRPKGVVVEWMDTGAACRTFNVLIGEGRRVVAALIAVD